jgi:hypothetical protein
MRRQLRPSKCHKPPVALTAKVSGRASSGQPWSGNQAPVSWKPAGWAWSGSNGAARVGHGIVHEVDVAVAWHDLSGGGSLARLHQSLSSGRVAIEPLEFTRTRRDWSIFEPGATYLWMCNQMDEWGQSRL